jgi:hypothetical protein
MGQTDVSEWLHNRRDTGDDSFYSAREISKKLSIDYIIALRAVNRLFAYGFLEIEEPRFTNRKFRVKGRTVSVYMPKFRKKIRQL